MNDRAHLITLEKYMEAVYMHSQLQAHCEQLQAEIDQIRAELAKTKEADADVPESD